MIKMRLLTKRQVIKRAYKRRSAERLRNRELRAELQRRRGWIEKERFTRLRYYFNRWVGDRVEDDWFTRAMDEESKRMSELFAPLVRSTLLQLEEARLERNEKKAGVIVQESTMMAFLIANHNQKK